jgi:hypothetical protein
MQINTYDIIESYIDSVKNNSPLSGDDIKRQTRRYNLNPEQLTDLIKFVKYESANVEHLEIKIKVNQTNIVIGLILTLPILYFFWWLIQSGETPKQFGIKIFLGAIISPFIILSSLLKKTKLQKQILTRKESWKTKEF